MHRLHVCSARDAAEHNDVGAAGAAPSRSRLTAVTRTVSRSLLPSSSSRVDAAAFWALAIRARRICARRHPDLPVTHGVALTHRSLFTPCCAPSSHVPFLTHSGWFYCLAQDVLDTLYLASLALRRRPRSADARLRFSINTWRCSRPFSRPLPAADIFCVKRSGRKPPCAGRSRQSDNIKPARHQSAVGGWSRRRPHDRDRTPDHFSARSDTFPRASAKGRCSRRGALPNRRRFLGRIRCRRAQPIPMTLELVFADLAAYASAPSPLHGAGLASASPNRPWSLYCAADSGLLDLIFLTC